MHIHRTRLAGAIRFAVATFALGAAPAFAQEREFDLPAGDAARVLPDFARQAQLQIVAPADRLEGVRTPALRGTMDAREALARLLAGSGLSVARDDGHTIALGGERAERALLASAAPLALDAPAAPAQDAAEPLPTPQAAPVDAAPATRDLDAVTVTGSFIRRIDSETALPVTTLSREQLDTTGATTLSEAMAYLPQSAGFDNAETSTGPNAARGDAASINLRGIGSGNTLVLLNGRRIAPHPISEGAVPRLSANINQIPLGAIERVEVLRDGASALYGSDAVAGVVNTILRRDYQGAEASVRHGWVDEGDMSETSVSLLGGRNFNGGRTNVMGFVGYYDRDPLYTRDKWYSRSGDLRERAGSDSTLWDNRSVSGPYGSYTTGRVGADGGFSAVRAPGLSGSAFHIAPDGDGTQVAGGAMPRELRYDYTPEYVLLPESTRHQVFGALNHLFGNGVEATLEGFYYRADSWTSNAASPISANADNGIYVPASNYYNPFGSRFYGPGTDNPDIAPMDVRINNYRPLELGPRTADVSSRAYQAVGGLRGQLGEWNWDGGLGYGRGETRDEAGNMLSESRLRERLALDTPDAFNPFGGPGANSQAVMDAVRIGTWREGEASLGVADFRATGPLMDLPGGTLQMAAGVEYRRETFDDRRDPLSNADDVIALSQTSDSSGSRNVRSGFLELSIPIFGDPNARPGFRRMEISLAGRAEQYSDFGTAAKPKFGFSWGPTDWLLLRGSYSEGFRAPTLAQVFVGEIVRRNAGTPDPYRADVTGTPADLGDESRQVIRGGNADLGPEEAKQHSIGFVLQPGFAEGLSLSLDYFRIRQSDVIDTYGEAQQLALDHQLRSSGQGANPAVVRLPVTDADRAAFEAWNAANPGDPRAPAGAVDYVMDTFINIAARTIAGYDASLAWRLPETRLGNFNLRLDVAYMDRYEERVSDDALATSPLRINGLPRTRGVLSVNWRRNALDAAVMANYIGSLYDTSAPVDADGRAYKVDDWVTVNAHVGVRLAGFAGGRSQLRFGANNLFDRAPPLADEDRAFFEGVHDGRGRLWYAEWRYTL
ncbi:TonB-dependent receptor [Luteimonas sp. Y-2-2-4F]|nr:TonB-dependent receptor [Luteimonas sp. Y-2-2-4F]MCD9033254.1 TonB-dependent receptor [Luteimonas sp. Y-2-2-4F]